jgi:hypothetical protein
MHVEIEGPREGSLEARASFALKVVGLLGAGGVLLAMFPPATPVPTLLVVMFNLAAAPLAAIYLVVAVGLGRRRRWAAAAARPLLVVMIAFGVYTVVEWAANGTIRIPFDVALATWALLGPADVKPIPRPERRSVPLAAGAVGLSAMMAFGNQLFGWGGAFDVQERDLTSAVAADCGAAGVGPPDRVKLSYDWSWSATGVMPSGTDIVVLGWTGADAEGHPLYVLDDIPDSGPGVYSALTGYPSTAMADEVGAAWEGRFRWAIRLPEQRFAPGHLELLLRLAPESPVDPSPLIVDAAYVHLGLWHHAAVSVTCSW